MLLLCARDTPVFRPKNMELKQTGSCVLRSYYTAEVNGSPKFKFI